MVEVRLARQGVRRNATTTRLAGLVVRKASQGEAAQATVATHLARMEEGMTVATEEGRVTIHLRHRVDGATVLGAVVAR